MRLNYKRKLFLYFLITIFVFGAIIILFQFSREKAYKAEKLESILDTYVNLTNKIYTNHKIDPLSDLKNFVNTLGNVDLRLTIIDTSGLVLYDSEVEEFIDMDNHRNREEVIQARRSGAGRSTRFSATTGQEFYYYTKKYNSYYIRAALPYGQKVEDFLKIDTVFVNFFAIVFVIIIFFLIYFTDHLGRSIEKLRTFAKNIADNNHIDDNFEFEKNELGEISSQIKTIYRKVLDTKHELLKERSKLYTHLNISGEGIAFFSKDKEKQISNKVFNQFVSFLIDEKPSDSMKEIFDAELFTEVNQYIDLGGSGNFIRIENSHIEFRKEKFYVEKGNKNFRIRVMIFNSGDFEIVINDITEEENYKKMKEQITSNISHELKTPVAVISGYMETILNSNSTDVERFMLFVEKSYHQTKRLASLINDISILNKIDEAGDLYKFEKINILSIVKNINFDYETQIKEHHINFVNKISSDLLVFGNRFLIDSIFRNLIDNSIKYAGSNLTLTIELKYEDAEYYYFSYKDNGQGIEKEHLPRIFERFYRIDKGRSRKLGGTGLGLSIVKHAIELHKGRIFVTSEIGKGVTFSFSLRKDKCDDQADSVYKETI
ncbi:MAG: two-component sensor histidine kinase [Candidatus Delongbacteria bacterium]|nr:two-component sensor histidine kinase [Candidatus Delongbacteria bacterium]